MNGSVLFSFLGHALPVSRTIPHTAPQTKLCGQAAPSENKQQQQQQEAQPSQALISLSYPSLANNRRSYL